PTGGGRKKNQLLLVNEGIKQMNTIKEIFTKSKAYWICLCITTILGYGFTLTNHAIGIDDTKFYYYFKQNGFLAQGRFGPNLTNKIFNMSDFLPFWNDFIALLLMVIGILIWCYFFTQISGGL
ncbi:MAG: glucosyltransferase domain-containing protein, partial [Oscillospiraceae bacterium]